VFTNLVYLNLLWLMTSLPVVTLPLSTASMFGVTRAWIKGDEPPIARTFFSLIREDARRNLLVGWLWAAVGAVLVADFFVVGQMGALRQVLYVPLFAISLLYTASSVFLFPTLAAYAVPARTVLKNAVLLPLARPFAACQGLLVIIVAAFLVASFPVLLILAGSATAYVLSFLWERSLRRVKELKGSGVHSKPHS